MLKDNEELGRILAAHAPSRPHVGAGPKYRGLKPHAGMQRIGEYALYRAAAILAWLADRLLRLAARLFLLGLLSRGRTHALLRISAYLGRAAVRILRRGIRRRMQETDG